MWIRIVAAVAVWTSAAVHLRLWFDGVRDQHVVGPAFLLNAVGGLVIGILLLAWRHWIPPLLAVGFGISTFSAFVISATVGLFGVHEHWVGGYVWTAAVAEIVALLAGVVILVREPSFTAERVPAGATPAQR
jgi:fluoride ion exporter CrcB/FEX